MLSLFFVCFFWGGGCLFFLGGGDYLHLLKHIDTFLLKRIPAKLLLPLPHSSPQIELYLPSNHKQNYSSHLLSCRVIPLWHSVTLTSLSSSSACRSDLRLNALALLRLSAIACVPGGSSEPANAGPGTSPAPSPGTLPFTSSSTSISTAARATT